jgi:type III secretion protein J
MVIPMTLGRNLRCLCLLLLAFVLSGCTREVLLRELTERDANEIVGVLYTSSVEAQKVADAKGKTFAVEVLSSDLPRAVAVLRALGLPKSPRTNLNEVFRSTGFAPTPFEERVRYLFGLAQELERTISLMEGVLQTRVHVVTPDSSSKLADLQQSKASVFLSYDDRYDIDIYVPRIRKMVSDSIEGLSPNRIEILAIPSRVDLKAAAEVPIKRVLGVRVHKHDATRLLVGFSLVLGLLALSVGLHLLTQLRSRVPGLDRRRSGRAAAEPAAAQNAPTRADA